MDSNNDSAFLKKNIDKVVATSALQKLSQLVKAHENELAEKDFLLKRSLLAITLALLYPVPAYWVLNKVIGEYLSLGYPHHNAVFSMFLLSWLLVFLSPFFLKRKSKQSGTGHDTLS
ncbi:MAG: hypothetical protein FD121_231 [Gallionellaceae bacterium]|nr:MAG: hypothetical protein FD121_231 [Gallionellaceae bacterium]